MPKIIENLDIRLLEEARRQLTENGYSAVTVRSVASACQVGVGTVYHYFPSKDALIAAVLLEDWMAFTEHLRQAEGFDQVLWAAYDGLERFRTKYQPLFRDEKAEISFPKAEGKYHPMLLGQLAAPLRPYCEDDFTADFIAEALLTWTLSGIPYGKLYGIIRKLV